MAVAMLRLTHASGALFYVLWGFRDLTQIPKTPEGLQRQLMYCAICWQNAMFERT